MRPGPKGEGTVEGWLIAAQSHLAPLIGAVAELKRALAVEGLNASGLAAELGSNVVAAGDALLKWLGRSEAPEPLRTAEGELAAAAGVYRNAASLFRSLPDADSEHRAARLNACTLTLNQGDHHVEAFANTVRSIVRPD